LRKQNFETEARRVVDDVIDGRLGLRKIKIDNEGHGAIGYFC
jgi:hypothetical protein